jgi:hypothetical protein
MKVGEDDCLMGSRNNGKICLWLSIIKGKQPNLFIMTFGYRSNHMARKNTAIQAHLKRTFFSRTIFSGKNFKKLLRVGVLGEIRANVMIK